MRQAAKQTESLLEKLLTPNTPINHILLYDAMRYSVMAGGKRVRPYLVLEFCRLYDGEQKGALYYAAAIEMLHTMSLIHDDLPSMDNDVLRRGKPTNHIMFGEAVAVLAGDSLLTEAFNTAAKNPYCDHTQNLEAVLALSEYGGTDGMMGGQVMDIQSEQKTVPLDYLDDLVGKKTAALLSCACLLGCIAAKAGEKEKKQAVLFGHYLGIAFQITDDILDFQSDLKTLGKSIGKDKDSKKATYASVLGVDKAKKLADELTQKSKDLLKNVQNDPSQRLSELCDFLLTRKY